MSYQIVFIQHIQFITHDVVQIRTDRPYSVKFLPGQATHVSVDRPDWWDKKRPFTFTSTPDADYLEFTIKVYREHNGVTNEIGKLTIGDTLRIHDVFGAIHYKGEGTFIAGGAGVTPFISILRTQKQQGKLGRNTLLFANKTRADIILKSELEKMLGQHFINILSEENHPDFVHGFFTQHFIGEHLRSRTRPIYICGPQPMIKLVQSALLGLGVSHQFIVKEEL